MLNKIIYYLLKLETEDLDPIMSFSTASKTGTKGLDHL